VPSDWLLVIGDRDPLAWILATNRMAFPSHRSRDAERLAKSDRMFLYTTRGCFRNPTRGRARVIGEAKVASSVTTLRMPVEFGDKSFPLGCSLSITGLVPRDEGPDMAGLLGELHLFSKSTERTWGIRVRRVLVPLDTHDARVLHEKLRHLMKPLADVKAGYLDQTGRSART
jgi:hypothetical protein